MVINDSPLIFAAVMEITGGMYRQFIFSVFFFSGLGVFSFTFYRLYQLFKLTKRTPPLSNIPKRIQLTLSVAFGQKKILRKPLVGCMHALVWWGFLVILVGTAEMIIDGFAGTDRMLSFHIGSLYNLITASGDVFACVIALICVAYLVRRNLMHIKRFSGIEMSRKAHMDANFAIVLILLLMITLMGMNIGYMKTHNPVAGYYPASMMLLPLFRSMQTSDAHVFLQINWWAHIGLIMIFLNILPYSKHFHVIMSVPNVFCSSLEPLMKINTMQSITREIKAMMQMQTSGTQVDTQEEISRFGIMDIEDISWKQYMDALTCTQCGRCTDVCPANLTGKLLSPRKIMIDTRKRMKQKGPRMLKEPAYDDGKSLSGDFITREEIWACTTCHACVVECPLNINHLSIITDIRRYFVLEKGLSRTELTQMFNNIENNGAPWQYARADRMNWAKDITMKQHE